MPLRFLSTCRKCRARSIVLGWGLATINLLSSGRTGWGDDVVPQPGSESATNIAGQRESAIPPLGSPYALISVRSVARSLDAMDYLFRSVLRQDVLDDARKAITDGGITLDESQGLNLQRPVGYLFTLPFQLGFHGNDQFIELAEPIAAGTDAPVEGTVATIGVDGATIGVDGATIGVDAEFEVATDGQVVVADMDVAAAGDPSDLLNQVVPVMFASITDRKLAKSYLNTAMTPETTLQPVGDSDELFQAYDAKSNATSFALRLAGNDVYLSEGAGDGNDLLTLEQIIQLRISPLQVAARHDVQGSLQFGHLTQRARKECSRILWQQAAPTLQQRDDEALPDFALRDATSRSLIELLDLLVTGVEAATLAADLREAERCVRVGLEIEAVEGTELAKRLAELKGPPSMFLPLHDPGAALSLMISVRMTEFERQLFARWVRWLRACIEAEDDDEDADLRSSMGLLCDSLQATIDAGILDVLVQFEIAGPTEVGVVGGLRLAKTSSFRTGLSNLADKVLQRRTAGETTELNVEPSHDLLIHHLHDDESLDVGGDEELDLDVAVGVGRGALWFAGGAIDSRKRLKAALDRMDEAAVASAEPQAVPPVLFTANGGEWQKLPLDDDFDAKLARGIAEEAFSKDDHVRLELRPTRRGAKLEGTLCEGFLRWFALTLATQHDQENL